MSSSIRAMATPFAAALTVLSAAGVPGGLAAQDVTFAGFTQGCFFQSSSANAPNTACTLNSTALTPNTNHRLRFLGSTFSTDLNFPLLTAENDGFSSGGVGGQQFGQMQQGTSGGYANGDFVYDNLTGSNSLWFRLAVNFDAGTPGAGAHIATFLWRITGGSTVGGTAGPIFNLTSVANTGMPTLGPNPDQTWRQDDVYHAPNATRDEYFGTRSQITAFGKNQSTTVGGEAFLAYDVYQDPSSVVPEPITLGLLATGLLGVGAARRRRLRGSADLG